MKARRAFLFFTVAGMLGFGIELHGAVTSVTVNSSSEKIFGEIPYLEVAATMNGEAPGGSYQVPITLAYPQESSQCNHAGMVDVVNTAVLLFTAFDGGGFAPPLSLARAFMGDDFIGENGYVYLSVNWDKFAMELSDPPLGLMAEATDGYQ